jgi:hypothetical protein
MITGCKNMAVIQKPKKQRVLAAANKHVSKLKLNKTRKKGTEESSTNSLRRILYFKRFIRG